MNIVRLRRIDFTVYNVRSLFIFIIVTILYPASAFPLELYLKDHFIAGNNSITLSDIALIKDKSLSNSDFTLPLQNLKTPLYIDQNEIKEILSRESIGVRRVYGKGVWVVPANTLTGEKRLKELFFQSYAKKKGENTLPEGLQIQILPDQKIMLPENGDVSFVIPDSLSEWKEGRRVLALDISGTDSQKNRHVIYRQMVVIDFIRSRNPELARDNIAEPAAASVTNEKIRVMHGDILEAVYRREGILVKLRSRALQSGKAGDTISVQLLFPSGKIAENRKARVVDHGIVEILH